MQRCLNIPARGSLEGSCRTGFMMDDPREVYESGRVLGGVLSKSGDNLAIGCHKFFQEERGFKFSLVNLTQAGRGDVPWFGGMRVPSVSVLFPTWPWNGLIRALYSWNGVCVHLRTSWFSCQRGCFSLSCTVHYSLFLLIREGS